jgi:hypothetical protein
VIGLGAASNRDDVVQGDPGNASGCNGAGVTWHWVPLSFRDLDELTCLGNMWLT